MTPLALEETAHARERLELEPLNVDLDEVDPLRIDLIKIELEGYAQERISADPSILADEVIRALYSTEYRDALSRTGLEVIEQHYRPERVYGPLCEAIAERVETVNSESAAGYSAATRRLV